MRMDRLTPVLRALAWIFPLQALGNVATALLTRELQFSWLAARDVLTYGLGYGVVGVATASLGWGVWAIVAAEVAQATAKAVGRSASSPHARRRDARPALMVGDAG